jgi:hyperosmotically inducible periplasmic protein
MHQAGADTGRAAKNAYTGILTVLDDTKIAIKVKTAFADGKDISSSDIHVTTKAGVVTLRGRVQGAEIGRLGLLKLRSGRNSCPGKA